MKEEVYYQFARIEDVHWWYEYRRRLIEDILSKLSFDNFHTAALEIGCGTGGSMRYLSKYCSSITGLDISETALELARKRYPEYKFIQGDANKLSSLFGSETFDLVFIFNVLYHKWIRDDASVLKQVYDILRPGGYIIVTEAAFRILWRRHDELVMGKRRYRIKEFESILSSVNFEDIKSTYFNSISFFPAFIVAWLERSGILKNENGDGEVDELKITGPLVNKLILGALNLERFGIRLFKRIPIGVSLLSLARRPLNKK